MIQILEISKPEDKWLLFDQRDRGRSLWIVGDRETQVTCEQREISRQSHLMGTQVQRFSDWMLEILKSNFPEITAVGKKLAIEAIREICLTSEAPHMRLPKSSEKIHDLIQFLAPQLTSPQSLERVRQWFFENPDAFENWGHWWISAADVLNRLMDRKIISATTAPGYLLGRIDDIRFSHHEFYFDLGTYLKPGETELLERLGQQRNVTLLVSRTLLRSKTHPGYERLRAVSQVIQSASSVPPKIRTRRFSTMLAEVKDAVAWARAQIDRGALIQEIVIAAPDVGLYWPALMSYLKVEGIPSERPQKAVDLAHPVIQQWLSKWRIAFGTARFGDAETFSTNLSLAEQSAKNLRLADLRKQMRAHWNGRIARLLCQRVGLLQNDWGLKKLTAVEFLSLVEPTVEGEESDTALPKALIQLASTSPADLKLPPHVWLELTEDILSRSESTVTPGEHFGIRITDLVSLQSAPTQYLYVLGLDQDSLKASESEIIRDQEAQSLFSFCGYHPSHHLTVPPSVVMDCLETEGPADQVWSFPETNFNGDPLTPSLAWLKQCSNPHHRDLPERTRWDEIQESQTLEAATHFSVRRWREDMGLESPPPIGEKLIDHVSASALKDYKRCPMIFASKRIFGLSDKSDLDTEIDPLTKGSIIHAFMEKIVQHPFRQVWTDQELNDEIESLDAMFDWSLLEAGARKKFISDLVKLGKKVLAFETDLRRQIPIRTVAHEIKLNLWIDLKTKTLVPKKPEQGIAIQGSIDRLDILNEEAVLVLDYKTGAQANLTNWGTWKKNHEFQFPVYLLATQADPNLNHGMRIAGALYYGLNPVRTAKGAVRAETKPLLAGRGKFQKADLSEEGFADLLQSWTKQIVDTSSQILDGQFPPVPEDPSDCEKCRWRPQCRAPHLR